ncbi:condensation domain-containing protein [Streptomyces sp. ODS05-4]|uniref:condensation domain-containing protein n=1 Tax=Streptomyces sp. ODS05-4 TaxID=2944939 RepID=UPI002109F59A|nr:condensation domain-containing protein [Streptomyces sp. ODS05-4]
MTTDRSPSLPRREPLTVYVDPGRAGTGAPPALELRGTVDIGRVKAAVHQVLDADPHGPAWRFRLRRHGPAHHTLTLDAPAAAGAPADFPVGLLADLLTARPVGSASVFESLADGVRPLGDEPVPLPPAGPPYGLAAARSAAAGAPHGPVMSVLRASPLQRELLADADARPGAGVGVARLGWEWHGPLDLERFADAWQSVADRESVLRAAFDDADEPAVLVHQWVVPELLRAPAGSGDRAALLAADRARALDPRRPGPFRVTVAESPAGAGDGPPHRMLLTYHHALLDDLSARLLLREFFRAYLAGGRLPGGERRPDMGDYVDWLAARDLGPARDFWSPAADLLPTAADLPAAGTRDLRGPAEDPAEPAEDPAEPAEDPLGWGLAGQDLPGPAQGPAVPGRDLPGGPAQGAAVPGRDLPEGPAQGAADPGRGLPGPAQGAAVPGRGLPGGPAQGAADRGRGLPGGPAQGAADRGRGLPGPAQGARPVEDAAGGLEGGDPRPATVRLRHRLSPEDAAGLTTWAARWGATDFGALQAAWALLLHRAGRAGAATAAPVAFCVSVSGRGVPLDGVERLPGALRNPLPMSVVVDPRTPVPRLLAQLRDRALDMAAYEWVSAGQVAHWTQPARRAPAGRGGRRVPGTLLVFGGGPQPPAVPAADLAAQGIRVPEPVAYDADTAFPLALSAHHDDAGGLVLTVAHDPYLLPDAGAVLADLDRLLRLLPRRGDQYTTAGALLDALSASGTEPPPTAPAAPARRAARVPLLRTLRPATGPAEAVVCLVPAPGQSPYRYEQLARHYPGPEAVVLLSDAQRPAEMRLAALAPLLGPGRRLVLGGFSGGGTAAYEIARLAAHAGGSPPLVVLAAAAAPAAALARALAAAAAPAG